MLSMLSFFLDLSIIFLFDAIFFKTFLLHTRSAHEIFSILLLNDISVISTFFLIREVSVQHSPTYKRMWYHIAIQQFFGVSNEIIPFVSALLSVWNAYFASRMCIRISVLYFPSSLKTLWRYLNLCT